MTKQKTLDGNKIFREIDEHNNHMNLVNQDLDMYMVEKYMCGHLSYVHACGSMK